MAQRLRPTAETLSGLPQPNFTGYYKAPIISKRNPTSLDTGYPIGQIWVNKVSAASYILSSVAAGAATWNVLSATAGTIATITGDSGGAESPLSGNFNLLGTANQIAVTGSANTETFSLIGPYTPSTYTAHGVLVGAGTSSIVALTAGSNGQVLLGSTGANPAFGTLTTTSGIAYTTGAGALAIDVKNGGFSVNSVAGTSSALAVRNAYIANNASATTFTLPATAAVGEMILISGGTANTAGWVIAQNSGQTIHQANSASTTGERVPSLVQLMRAKQLL